MLFWENAEEYINKSSIEVHCYVAKYKLKLQCVAEMELITSERHSIQLF
jgi:hypothetical protein